MVEATGTLPHVALIIATARAHTLSQTRTTLPMTSPPPSGARRRVVVPPCLSLTPTHSFNLTSSEPEAEPAPTPTPAPIATVPEEQQFKWSVQTGNFTVWVVNMRTPSRTWQPGETATVEFAGEVINKRIEAGTLKYQVWESYVEHFVAQGNSPYFQCTHKGCDPTKAVALAIDYPVHRPSPYKMHFTFPIPEPKKTGDFRVVVWGEDHTPYDFSLTITFNATTAAY